MDSYCSRSSRCCSTNCKMQSASPVAHPRGRCKPTTSLPLALSLPCRTLPWPRPALSPPRGSTMATTRPRPPVPPPQIRVGGRARPARVRAGGRRSGPASTAAAALHPPWPPLLPILVGALEKVELLDLKAELLDPAVELLDPVTREAGDRAEAGGRRRRSGPALSACGLDSPPRARIRRRPFFPWRRRRAQTATSSDGALGVSARGAALLPPQARIRRLPLLPLATATSLDGALGAPARGAALLLPRLLLGLSARSQGEAPCARPRWQGQSSVARVPERGLAAGRRRRERQAGAGAPLRARARRRPPASPASDCTREPTTAGDARGGALHRWRPSSFARGELLHTAFFCR
jgi:hypothetical protein